MSRILVKINKYYVAWGVLSIGVLLFLLLMSNDSLLTAILLYSIPLVIILFLGYIISKNTVYLKLLVPSLTILIVLEIGFRLFATNLKTYNERIGLPQYFSIYSPTSNSWYHRNEPNRTFSYGQSEFSYVRQSNNLGLFTLQLDEVNHSKYKILCLGDSFTEGVGASSDSCWPVLLNQKLNLAYPDSFQVINVGISGSDVFYEWKLYDDLLRAYKPNEIIFFIGYSDFGDVIIRGGDERFLADSTVAFNKAPWIEPLFVKSFICRFVMLSILDYGFNLITSTSYREQEESACQLIKAKLEDIASHEDINIKAVIFPHPPEIETQGYYSPFARNLLNSTFFHGIDLLEQIQDKHPNIHQDIALYSWPKDGHYNGKGYNLIADLIFENIIIDD